MATQQKIVPQLRFVQPDMPISMTPKQYSDLSARQGLTQEEHDALFSELMANFASLPQFGTEFNGTYDSLDTQRNWKAAQDYYADMDSIKQAIENNDLWDMTKATGRVLAPAATVTSPLWGYRVFDILRGLYNFGRGAGLKGYSKVVEDNNRTAELNPYQLRAVAREEANRTNMPRYDSFKSQYSSPYPVGDARFSPGNEWWNGGAPSYNIAPTKPTTFDEAIQRANQMAPEIQQSFMRMLGL